ncbi:MFS transporter [Microbacterium oryzae]|uniref:MFS transporter n=1 Tax=Microbacterium oryzae TaxID=743009 RepID=UPI0025B09C03|nr:MFS transporter [Microbacterium oryzae]MDN3312108.1 MFS transporter [Microbacterium oryzae]
MTSTAPIRRDTRSSGLRGNPTATLVSVAFGLFMVGLDATVVSIANPAIAADLGTSFAELQWITNVYLLGLAAFLILGGKIGDRFGRRRTYVFGVAAFALTSVAIGLVGSTTGVIVFRALQGASAAMLMPQTLALLRSTFPRERFGMAVGVWGGVSSVAIAAGPIVGGALVATLGWESIFYINAPIALIGVIFSALALKESTAERQQGRFDILGVILLATGLASLIVAIVQAEVWGWSSGLTIGAFVLGIVLLGLFVLTEWRTRNPLLPLTLFGSRGFSIGGLAIGTNFFTLLGVTFFLTLYLMNLRGIEGLTAGLMLLPLSGVSIIASPIAAVVVHKITAKWTMITGLLLIAVSFFSLVATSVDSPYWGMVIPFVALSFGVGFTMTAGADSIVGSAPVQYAGVAGGFQATMLQLGGALGTAVFAAVVSSSVNSGTESIDLTAPDRGSLAQGIVPAQLTGADVVAAQDAFLNGFHNALVVGATVAVVVAALALVFIRTRRHASVKTVLEETVEGEAGHR